MAIIVLIVMDFFWWWHLYGHYCADSDGLFSDDDTCMAIIVLTVMDFSDDDTCMAIMVMDEQGGWLCPWLLIREVHSDSITNDELHTPWSCCWGCSGWNLAGGNYRIKSFSIVTGFLLKQEYSLGHVTQAVVLLYCCPKYPSAESMLFKCAGQLGQSGQQ